jgi:hypothetical protein
LDSDEVEKVRRTLGGQLQPLPVSQTRWYLSDLESAEIRADQGDMTQLARLMRAADKDGTLTGVMSTRTMGLVCLPKRFRGDAEIVEALRAGEAGEKARSVFDEMHPPQELARLAADGIKCGVAVGELLPIQGRDYPVLVRLDPEFLYYRWVDNTWYFRSVAGLIPITPGDGRWVLHVPGGRNAPWQAGLWRALGQAWIRKTHANLHKDNWEAKLANPARVAVAPQGGTEPQKLAWFQAVMAWGVNTVFGLTPGYDVKLIESNGRGAESFAKTVADANAEMIIAVAGQTVTTDGGAGFANADIHKSIRADLIKATADALAFTVNTQTLPVFVTRRWGEEAIDRTPTVEWDVTPPKDRAQEATSLVSTATAINQLIDALARVGMVPDVQAICSKFGVPVQGDRDGDGAPDEAVTPAAQASQERSVRAA